MSSNEWPAWRYGPKGEAEIFQKIEDVPKGWQMHPSAFKQKEPESDDNDGEPTLTREQIMQGLTRRNIEFKTSASTKTLYRRLKAAMDTEPPADQ